MCCFMAFLCKGCTGSSCSEIGAKTLTLLPRPPHVSLLLGDLGWLRVKHQLDLKIALMAYNAEYNAGSVCFIYAAAFYELSHCLRSSEVNFIGHSKP